MRLFLIPLLATAFFLLPEHGQAQSAVPTDSTRSLSIPPKEGKLVPSVATDSTRVVIPPKSKPVIKPRPRPIDREFSGGIQINSDGYSVLLEKGTVRSEESGERANMFYNVRSYSLEFTEYFSPNELKSSQSSDPNQGSRSQGYTFGKAANFYAVKLGMNFRKMIAGKPESGTVSIHWVNGGGLAVGLVKPYYVTGNFTSGNGPIKYEPATANNFLDAARVTGKGPFAEGLKELKINPGLHLKSALRFDFANNKKRLTALETGVAAAYYFQPVEIMATKKPQSLFVNVYAALHFGKRYAGKERY